MIKGIIAGIIIAAIGVALFWLFSEEDRLNQEFMRKASSAEAAVVDVISSLGDGIDGVDKYSPIVSYEYKGIKYENIALEYSEKRVCIGEIVKVYFYAGNPSNARLRPDKKAKPVVKQFFYGFGVVVIFFSFVDYFSNKKKLKNSW